MSRTYSHAHDSRKAKRPHVSVKVTRSERRGVAQSLVRGDLESLSLPTRNRTRGEWF